MDRRMLDFVVGLDTEFSEIVDGSHLYTPSVEIDDVILPAETKALVVDTVANFDEYKRYQRKLEVDKKLAYGRGMALLFHGASGVGKTMLANAIATTLRKKVLLINFPNLGENEAGVLAKLIFREAKIHDALLFFDECESIFRSRERDHAHRVNMMLTELEPRRPRRARDEPVRVFSRRLQRVACLSVARAFSRSLALSSRIVVRYDLTRRCTAVPRSCRVPQARPPAARAHSARAAAAEARSRRRRPRRARAVRAHGRLHQERVARRSRARSRAARARAKRPAAARRAAARRAAAPPTRARTRPARGAAGGDDERRGRRARRRRRGRRRGRRRARSGRRRRGGRGGCRRRGRGGARSGCRRRLGRGGRRGGHLGDAVDLREGARHQLRGRSRRSTSTGASPTEGLDACVAGGGARAAPAHRRLRQGQVGAGQWGFGGERAKESESGIAAPSTGLRARARRSRPRRSSTSARRRRPSCAQLISKWVGESAKNIEAVFDEAKANGALLVFDEAEGFRPPLGRGGRRGRRGPPARTTSACCSSASSATRRRPRTRAGLDAAFNRRFTFIVELTSPTSGCARASLRASSACAARARRRPRRAARRYALTGGQIRSVVMRGDARRAARRRAPAHRAGRPDQGVRRGAREGDAGALGSGRYAPCASSSSRCPRTSRPARRLTRQSERRSYRVQSMHRYRGASARTPIPSPILRRRTMSSGLLAADLARARVAARGAAAAAPPLADAAAAGAAGRLGSRRRS